MRGSVVIKSYPNGIALYLDPELDFSLLCQEVAQKFRQSGRFFKDSSMAVSFEGRTLSEEEERKLADVISENASFHLVCIVGKDEKLGKYFQKSIADYAAMKEEGFCPGQFFRGTLRDNQILETESSIIILGDVEAGCSVISAGDIIVLGALRGNAYAGGDGNSSHFIAALEMAPVKLKIGDFKYKAKEKKGWFKGRKIQPEMAVVKDGAIVLTSVTKELLNGYS